MLEFLQLLEKKMPAGFSVCIQRTVLGFNIEFRHGRVYTQVLVHDGQLEHDMRPEARQMFSEMIFEDMIRKIRNHSQYAKS